MSLNFRKELRDRKSSGTIACPNCGCINPKRGFACSSCRLPLDLKKPASPDNIEMLKWRCTFCTMDNETPKDKPEICSACTGVRR